MKDLMMLAFLELIESTAVTATDLFIMATPNYGSNPIRNIQKRLNYQHGNPKSGLNKFLKYIKNKRMLYNLLYRLRTNGLIIERSGIIKSTLAGQKRKDFLKTRTRYPLPSSYKKEIGHEVIIITFDIHEREREKRDWLRRVLIILGFKKLQKSVWIGKIKLPVEFIEALHKLNLISCVEILAVTRTGSINHII